MIAEHLIHVNIAGYRYYGDIRMAFQHMNNVLVKIVCVVFSSKVTNVCRGIGPKPTSGELVSRITNPAETADVRNEVFDWMKNV